MTTDNQQPQNTEPVRWQFVCEGCGVTKADEDGCCASCGADCSEEAVPLHPPQDITEELKAMLNRIDNSYIDATDPPTDQQVPDAAKLTLSEIAPYSVVGTFYDYPETWEALRPLADAATKKAAVYIRETEVTPMALENITVAAKLQMRDAEVAELRQQLTDSHQAGRDSRAPDFRKWRDALVLARKERDAALEQARALVEAIQTILEETALDEIRSELRSVIQSAQEAQDA